MEYDVQPEPPRDISLAPDTVMALRFIARAKEPPWPQGDPAAEATQPERNDPRRLKSTPASSAPVP